METYTCRWRRVWLPWGISLGTRVERDLIGHKLDQTQDKLVFYYRNGSLREVCRWSTCEMNLGTDWVLWTKDQLAKKTGTDIKLSVDTNG